MSKSVVAVAKQVDPRPLVRPTYSQIDVHLLPPYGDPEVSLLGELGTYAVTGVLLSAFLECLNDE